MFIKYISYLKKEEKDTYTFAAIRIFIVITYGIHRGFYINIFPRTAGYNQLHLLQ